jgi:hypothetical protein
VTPCSGSRGFGDATSPRGAEGERLGAGDGRRPELASAAGCAAEIVDRAFQDWVRASRALDCALEAWLEARHANEAAARRYRMALAEHGAGVTGEVRLDTRTVRQAEVAA